MKSLLEAIGNLLKDCIVKNWLTTVAGITGAVTTYLAGGQDANAAASAIVIALLGLFAKSATQTGTTASKIVLDSSRPKAGD